MAIYVQSFMPRPFSSEKTESDTTAQEGRLIPESFWTLQRRHKSLFICWNSYRLFFWADLPNAVSLHGLSYSNLSVACWVSKLKLCL
jgi:hypothetical protein